MIVNSKKYSRKRTSVSLALLITFCLVSLTLSCMSGVKQGKTDAKPEPSSPYKLVDVDTTPRLIKIGKPLYTLEAAQNRITGNVVVEMIVTKEGIAAEPVVVTSFPEGVYDEVAIEAVKQYRFKPATIKRKPVDCIVKQPIIFSWDTNSIGGAPYRSPQISKKESEKELAASRPKYYLAARDILRNAATAQEAYYVDHKTYTQSKDELFDRRYGFKPMKEGFHLNIIKGGEHNWEMEVYHNNGTKLYNMKGPGGSVTGENFSIYDKINDFHRYAARAQEAYRVDHGSYAQSKDELYNNKYGLKSFGKKFDINVIEAGKDQWEMEIYYYTRTMIIKHNISGAYMRDD
jgi:TonB family protein